MCILTIYFLSHIKYNIGKVVIYMKTGRPKAIKPKSVRFSIRLDEETEARLIAYCNMHGITKGEAVRRGILKLLRGDE